MDANSSKNGIKFHYFWDKQFNPKKVSKGHNGIIAVMTVLNKSTKRLKIAFAYCSPKDVFDHSIAHKICEGRLNCCHFVERPFTGNSYVDVANYFNELDKEYKPNFCKRWIINEKEGTIFY